MDASVRWPEYAILVSSVSVDVDTVSGIASQFILEVGVVDADDVASFPPYGRAQSFSSLGPVEPYSKRLFLHQLFPSWISNPLFETLEAIQETS